LAALRFSSKRCFNVFHEQEEAKGIARRHLETEALVESRGSSIFGVHHHGAAADDVGRLGALI
jgi:hypothetical protein